MIARLFSWLGYEPKWPEPCVHPTLLLGISDWNLRTRTIAVLGTEPSEVEATFEVRVHVTCARCGASWDPVLVKRQGSATAWIGDENQGRA